MTPAIAAPCEAPTSAPPIAGAAELWLDTPPAVDAVPIQGACTEHTAALAGDLPHLSARARDTTHAVLRRARRWAPGLMRWWSHRRAPAWAGEWAPSRGRPVSTA